MIQKINHKKGAIAKVIYDLFQVSYPVEASILKIDNFPPLQRTIDQFVVSDTEFYAFYENQEAIGVVEIKSEALTINIDSLVVHPKCFRKGIGMKLVSHVFKIKDADIFTVETGLKNKPAIHLYKKLGFREIKQWDTSFGVRKIKLEKTNES